MPQFLDLNLPHLEAAGIVIDAQANEPAWEEALVVDEFVSYRPVPDGEPVTKATVRLMSDEKALYVHFSVFDPEPDRVFARYSNRDNIWRGDTVGIYLDPAGDGQRAYLFMCSPYGIQADAHRVAGQRDRFSWDGHWQSSGQRTSEGFEVELAIPWSTVRHPSSMDHVGVSLLYSTYRESQRSGWPRRDPNIAGIIIQQAVLGGPGKVPPGKRFQVIPDLTFGLDQDGISQTRLGAYGLAPGATLRWDPVPELTVLATGNPDFSQVEGDEFQIDVNQRYAIYYEEKRPFFLEGQEWLDPGEGLVYTRSMQMPRYGVRATAEQGDWKTAVLHVLDAAPSGTVHELGGWTDEEMLDENGDNLFAINTLARTRRSLSSDGHVGGFFSDKRIAGTNLQNQVVSFDMRSRLSETTSVGANYAGSITELSSGERSSGTTAGLGLSHENRDWEFNFGAGAMGADFRAENGYITRGDSFGVGGELQRMFYPETDAVRSMRMTVDAGSEWRLNGDLRSLEVSPNIGMRLLRNTYASIYGNFWKEEYTGQLFQGPYAGFSFMQSFSKYWGLSIDGGGGQGIFFDEENPRVVDEMYASTSFTLRPTERLSLANSVTWQRLAEHGSSLEEGYVARIYFTGFLSKHTWIRSILDYSSFSDSLELNTLLAWQRNPGTAFYAGMSNDLSDDSWQAFTKLSWSLGF